MLCSVVAVLYQVETTGYDRFSCDIRDATTRNECTVPRHCCNTLWCWTHMLDGFDMIVFLRTTTTSIFNDLSPGVSVASVHSVRLSGTLGDASHKTVAHFAMQPLRNKPFNRRCLPPLFCAMHRQFNTHKAMVDATPSPVVPKAE